jgi:hypothetical protein
MRQTTSLFRALLFDFLKKRDAWIKEPHRRCKAYYGAEARLYAYINKIEFEYEQIHRTKIRSINSLPTNHRPGIRHAA